LYREVYTLLRIQKTDKFNLNPIPEMNVQIPPYYITRAAKLLRKLREKQMEPKKREAEASRIIGIQASNFFNTCVNPRFTLGDVKSKLGLALSERCAGKNATAMLLAEACPCSEPPPGHRFKSPPEPEEWMREETTSRQPKGRPVGKIRQQDFFPQLFAIQNRVA
jgi:hypothetical protein